MAMTKHKTFWAIALYFGQRVVMSLTIVSSRSNTSHGDVCDLTLNTCQRDINNLNVIQSINIYCDHFHNDNRTVSLSSLAPLIIIRNCAQLTIGRKAISSDQDSTVLKIVNDDNQSHNLKLESESITGKFSIIVIRNVRSAVVENGAIRGECNEAEITHSEFQLLEPSAFAKLFVKNLTFKDITVKTWSTGSFALPYVCKQNLVLEMVKIKNCEDDPALVQKLVSPPNYDRNSNWACNLGKSLMCQDDTTSHIETASCDRVKHVNDLQAKFREKYSKNNCQCENQCVLTSTGEVLEVQEIVNCELSLKSKDLADVTNKDFRIAFINTRINIIESQAFANLKVGLIGLIGSKISQIESKAFDNVSVDVFKMESSYEMNSLRVTKTAHAAFDIIAERVLIQDSSFDFLDDHTFHYIKPRGKSSEMEWKDIMIQEFRPNALVLDENWLSQNIQAGRIKIQQNCGCETGEIVGEKHNHDQPFMKKDSIWCMDPDTASDRSWTEYEEHKCEFHELIWWKIAAFGGSGFLILVLVATLTWVKCTYKNNKRYPDMPLSLDQSAVDAKEEFQELSVVMSQGSQEGQQQPTFNIIDQTSFQNQPEPSNSERERTTGIEYRPYIDDSSYYVQGNRLEEDTSSYTTSSTIPRK